MRRQSTTRAKYGNRKVTILGLTFDSIAEAKRYEELKLLEYAGEIRGLVRQPRYVLQEAFFDNEGKRNQAIVYVGDFFYRVGGQNVVEDVKGIETPVFKIKAKLFRKHYDGVKLVVVGSGYVSAPKRARRGLSTRVEGDLT